MPNGKPIAGDDPAPRSALVTTSAAVPTAGASVSAAAISAAVATEEARTPTVVRAARAVVPYRPPALQGWCYERDDHGRECREGDPENHYLHRHLHP